MVYSFELYENNAEGREGSSAIIMITLEGGEKYVGSLYTLDEVCRQNQEHKSNGEFLSGSYFWSSNMIILEKITQNSVKDVINHLLASDGFYNAFFPANHKAVETLNKQVN